jgi:Ca-activated chloride channel family protein
LVESIVQLSLRYGIITPYTSFIITEDDILGQGNQTRIIDQINPTATALALMPSGQNAVDAAQASGGLSNQGVAATMPAAQPPMFPTASAVPTMHFMAEATNLPPVIVTPAAGFGTPLPTSSPSLTIVTATPLPGGGTVKAVGDRTFILRDGVWIDTTFDPDEMQPIEIEFLSDEYFELMAEDARIAEFYALGEQVIFVLDGIAYQIVL